MMVVASTERVWLLASPLMRPLLASSKIRLEKRRPCIEFHYKRESDKLFDFWETVTNSVIMGCN
jgi:hypothetical protein